MQLCLDVAIDFVELIDASISIYSVKFGLCVHMCVYYCMCVWLWLWDLYMQFAMCLLLCWTCRLSISMVVQFKNLLLFLAVGYIKCNQKLCE